MNLKTLLLISVLIIFNLQNSFSAEKLTISEFMAVNSSGLQDEDLEFSDWIEIQNTGENEINLNGYILTDNPQNLIKWKFPEVTLAAGSFMIVFADEKNRVDPTKPLHTNFKLSGSGEFLALLEPDGKTIISSFEPQFPPQSEDVSYGIYNGLQAYFDQPTPGAANVLGGIIQSPAFSKIRGYYSDSFYLSLADPDPDAKIYYTTDGKRPNAENGILYVEPIKIQTTTPLSAIAIKNDGASAIVTNTYFFIDSILKQTNHPVGYPAEWGPYETIPGVAIADYEMDPEVCEDPKYKRQFEEAFLSIPTVSIVTDPNNLFSQIIDAKTGGIYIYTNSTGNGIGSGWERPVSVEYIDPKAQTWIQANCGLQIHGGQSRVPEKTPKHSFRLKFRSEYGPSTLDFPIFEEPDATTEFNTLVLRANYGYTWLHMTSTERKNAKYVQDSWAKDTQLAMGDHSAHNKFAHLFLNGIYWGLYNISEKLDKDFMGTYLKGKADDFDVVKDYNEIADGNLNEWEKMLALANKGLKDVASYQKIQGNNPDGTANAYFEPLLDVENLIDYMLMNFYAGNNDWDHHNWTAARNRVVPGKGFKFFSWDAEHLFTSSTLDNTKENNPNCPSHIFTQLKENDEFRILLADHIQNLFFDGGLLTPESATERYMKRANEIEKAILCESARWGDYRRDVHPRDSENDLYTPDKYWIKERDWMTNTYFPPRTNLVINQLRMSGLYPWVDAPQFSTKSGSFDNEFDLEMYSTSGIIYYTVNGIDPRETGGEITPTEVYSYGSPVKINGNGTVKARVKEGTQWSALTEAKYKFTDPTLILTGGYGTKKGSGNFPNPFRSETKIFYNLEKESTVQIRIYNDQGRQISQLFDGIQGAGTHYQEWNPVNLENGIYLYQIQTNTEAFSGKMMYMK